MPPAAEHPAAGPASTAGAGGLVMVADTGRLDADWPYLRARLHQRLAAAGMTTVDHRADRLPLRDHPARDDVTGLALFGVEAAPDDFTRLPNLRVVAGETDRCGLRHIDTLWERGIPFIDVTAGWSQSVAEVAIALTLAALRGIVGWHQRLAAGLDRWEYPHWQFCDDPRYVNGTLAGKRLAIVGLGAIGGTIASLAGAFGADVAAVDPFVPDQRFTALRTRRLAIGDVPGYADILVVAATPCGCRQPRPGRVTCSFAGGHGRA